MRTFTDALPPDAERLIRNYRRRLSYQYRLDRPKRYAGSAPAMFDPRPGAQAHDESCLAVLENPPTTEAYVDAWWWLNHLTHCAGHTDLPSED